jgi:DNA-binding LytR/AlgR family response regulator
MLNIMIIEDEQPAVENLLTELKQVDTAHNIVAILHSVEESIRWFKRKPSELDVVFMDIHLADGLSFNIFNEIEINTPVIFTTAFDKYLMESFQYNGIDYLLKPICPEKLKQSLAKFKNLKTYFTSNVLKMLAIPNNEKPAVKDRIIVKKGIEFQSIKTEDVAFFYTEHKLVFLVDKEGKKFMTHANNLSELMVQLNNRMFYRANRKYIVNINYIKKYKPANRVKLEVDLVIPISEPIIISQENTSDFKQWIENL